MHKSILSLLAALSLFSCATQVATATPVNVLPPNIQEMVDLTVRLQAMGGLGSGVLIDKDTVLTAKHVVSREHIDDASATADNAHDYIVEYGTGELVRADRMLLDPSNDDAIVRAVSPVRSTYAKFDCKPPFLGEQVFIIGMPLGLPFVVSSGFVSSVQPMPGGMNGLIPISAIVNHGNSGGPVFNSEGRLVGILTDMYNTTDSAGPGLMLPSTTLCQTLPINDQGSFDISPKTVSTNGQN